MADGYQFDAQSVRRIADAVKAIETRVSRLAAQGVSSKRLDAVQWVPFKNTTSEDAPRNAVMRVTGVVTANQEYYLECAKPSTTFGKMYAVNSPVAVPYNQFGLCATGGLLEVLYDAGTPAQGDGYGPKPDQWSLSKNYPQSALIHGLFDTTNKIALCEWMPISTGIGKANATIANRASGAISIWAGPFGTEVDITGMDISSAFNLGPSVASGDWLSWSIVNGEPCFVKLCS
jgi:hypothetical protein